MLKNFTRLVSINLQLLVVFLLLTAINVQAQTTIARWNFNSTFNIPANGNAPVPSSGVSSGTINLIGGVTADTAAGTTADFGNPNNGLNTKTYPSQSTSAKSAGIEVTVNTTGYNAIKLNFYIRHSGSAAKKIVIQYYDGASWQDVATRLATNTNFVFQSNIDLTAYPALNNNAVAKLRIVTDFSSGSMYEGATGAYSPGVNGGTIRYDLITITGNTLSCIGPATQQASGLRLLKTDATSAQLTLNRGDGGGCLVLCSNTGVPSVPANNNVYAANAVFGSGTAVGNSYAVYNTQVNNPAIQYFNINTLSAGIKYYLAAYEYSDSGSCYLPTPFVDSFYCNSTVLYPGDVQFLGYDNNVVSGGDDAFALVSLSPLNTGTAFEIVNSRYEAGAAADTRTNRWYAGGNSIYQNLQRIKILYSGAPTLAAGSIISFDFKAPNGYNIRVNGFPTTSISVISENIITGNSMLVAAGAEQFFIAQGKFTTNGTPGVNQYSVLDGHVLHGISYTNNWVSFNASPSIGSNIADRQSRIPPDIEGLHLFFANGDFAYYNPGSLHNGTQNALLSAISNNAATWTFGADAGINQINAAVLTTAFSPNRLTAAGTWTGNANDNNWFNSLNWEGLFVPDSLTDVTIPAAKFPQINANAAFANLYNRTAITRALTIGGGVPLGGNLSLSGTSADKLVVYDSLLVDTTGRFSALGGGIDTIILRGNLQRRDGADLNAFNNSFLSLDGNRQLKPIDVWLITGTIYTVRKLGISNPPGVRLLNGGIETTQQIELNNGVLSIVENFARYSLSQTCTILSPLNVYGEFNRGWEKSFIDGRVNISTNAVTAYTAPVGSAAKNIFSPLVFEPDNSDLKIYSVSYMAVSHPSVSPSDISTPPLDHVSELEYWTLNSPNPAAAKVTLYYTPYSRVSGAGNTAQALQDLRVAQYWDSISSGNGTNLWRFPGAGSHTVTGDSSYGKIRYNDFATDLSFSSQNFTLGTISHFNTLPVQLLTWKATPQFKQVRLTWQVADESDVNYYTVEKSTDGVHFTSLQKVNKAITISYATYDTKPVDGWNYYRLKATGTDGKTFYSDIQKVWFVSAGQWLVYPNPAKDVLWLQLPNAGTVTLYTMDGKVMLQRKLPASLNKLPVQSFAKGLYLLEYFDGRKRQSQKINLQ